MRKEVKHDLPVCTTLGTTNSKITEYKYKMNWKVWRWVEIRKHSSDVPTFFLNFNVIFISRNQNENNHAKTNRWGKKNIGRIFAFLGVFFHSLLIDVVAVRSFVWTLHRLVFHEHNHSMLRFDFVLVFSLLFSSAIAFRYSVRIFKYFITNLFLVRLHHQ